MKDKHSIGLVSIQLAVNCASKPDLVEHLPRFELKGLVKPKIYLKHFHLQ